jgi:magnesium-transporting ATPase (P-type)
VESEGRQSAITEQQKAQRAPAAAGSTASGLDDLFNRLRSSPAGLTAAEAARRVKEAGPNDPAATKRGGPLAEFLRFCASPLVIILFVASVTAALLGQVSTHRSLP